MRKTKLLGWGIAFALAILAVPVAGFLRLDEPDVGQECADRIQIGMDVNEAEKIVTEYGYELTGGGVEASGADFVYTRAGCKTVGFGTDHKSHQVSCKWIGDYSARENLAIRIWRRLTQ